MSEPRKGKAISRSRPPILIVDEEFKNFLPPLSDEERAGLEKAIKQACRAVEPIYVWEGHNIILDGMNRYEICCKHRLKCRVVTVNLPDRAACFRWIYEHQAARRNWSDEQRRYVVGRLIELEKGKPGRPSASDPPKKGAAASPFSEGCGNSPKKGAAVASFPGSTAERIAQQSGISERAAFDNAKYARNVDAIEANGAAELKEGILSGAVKATDAAIATAAKLPAPELRQAADNVRKGMTLDAAVASLHRANGTTGGRHVHRDDGPGNERNGKPTSRFHKAETLFGTLNREIADLAEELGQGNHYRGIRETLRTLYAQLLAWKRSEEKTRRPTPHSTP